MCVMLFVVLVFSLQSPPQPPPSIKYPASAARIERLFHTFTTANDDKLESAARKSVQEMYASHGLFTIAEVGDEPSYEFVVLLSSDAISLDRRAAILDKVHVAAARGDLSADAASFFAARLRFDRIKHEAASHPPANPQLRDQIERMSALDQEVRQPQGFNMRKLQEADRKNTALLLSILNRFGVPTYSLVGPQAAADFFTMIQHQSPEFRRRVLPQLKANAAAGEADPQSFAMVYDRSRSDAGQKQLYGEQLVCKAGEKMHEAPMVDPANVNQRRAELGLIRVELYARLLAELEPQFCPPASSKK